MVVRSQVLRVRLHLLRELHAGTRAPGAAISVKETAEILRTSHTPVREALTGLAGEGLVGGSDDRNGFIVPRLGARGLAEWLDLTRLLVSRAMADGPTEPPPDRRPDDDDPVPATEAMLGWLVSGCGNELVTRTIGRAGVLLAPYRRAETDVLPDWAEELGRVVSGARVGDLKAFHTYWRRRIDRAAALVDAVERRHRRPTDIFRI